ncbi:MAG: hypothetical protein GC156_11420 [Actinomycetales bacterium]|nr:hypothetical protein [Actinomycetales bacterium]
MARLAGEQSPLVDEPWRSLWSAAQMAEALGVRGWTVVEDVDMLTYARRIGAPAQRTRSLSGARVVIAEWRDVRA